MGSRRRKCYDMHNGKELLADADKHAGGQSEVLIFANMEA